MTSVDGPHRERVAKYVVSELSREFQVLITTHNRQWYEWLLQLENAEGARTRFANQEIIDWSLESGPAIHDMVHDYSYLLEKQSAVAYQFLVPPAGRLLESVLQQLRFSLELAVPARPGDRYTIGDIWGKFRSDASKKYPGLWRHIARECDELDDTWIVRNWGTHGTTEARELTRAEAMQFIGPILALYPKLVCQNCGLVVKVSGTPKGAVACRCGALNYQPDLRPAQVPGSPQMSFLEGIPEADEGRTSH